MVALGQALRRRAATLGLSDSEVARRVGLSQARYHAYVAGTAEPDLGTLCRICTALATDPNAVLSFSQADADGSPEAGQRARISAAAAVLTGGPLRYAAELLDTVVRLSRSGPALD